MNSAHLDLPIAGGYHRPYTADAPDSGYDPRFLHTLPYCDLIESLAECLFPDNEVRTTGAARVMIKARDARPERYVLFRAAWDTDFAVRTQEALCDFSTMCRLNMGEKHFLLLSPEERLRFLEQVSKGTTPVWTSQTRSTVPAEDQKKLFGQLHALITGAVLGEPGYGGNYRGIGWYYTNFITPKA